VRILLVHNLYGHGAQGGEDGVLRREAALLESRGHTVRVFTCLNAEATAAPALTKLLYFLDAAWSPSGADRIRREIDLFRPDVMHVHNFWLVLSPSIFEAARQAGVATVMTLHNYRLACVGGTLMCGGQPCEDCLGRPSLRGVWRRCYRHSAASSLAVWRMLREAERRGVWQRDVDRFIALTEFGRAKFVAAGLPADRIIVKPNFLDDPMAGLDPEAPGHGALFIGRLAEEKGVRTLLEAWQPMAYPLTILGDGPLAEEGRAAATPHVRLAGHVAGDAKFEHLARARLLVVPSEWYEGLPTVILEAMAMGRPVVASRRGAMAESIDDGRTGLLFEPGNAADLRAKVERLAGDATLAAALGREARRRFLERYTAEANYPQLINIYKAALGQAVSAGPAVAATERESGAIRAAVC
jgi:glycosyltransferase involved in cell wall biosynthesis